MTESDYRERALAQASAHVRRFGVLPSTFRRCVTNASVREETYSRALHDVERRTLVQRVRAAPFASRGDGAPPSVEGDPWSFDPQTIEADTLRVCRCPTCQGSARVLCSNCNGTGQAKCSRCWGTGRVAGARNRTKKCPVCRERGRVPCGAGCSAGQVGCRACEASGRVEAWLAMERQRLALVSVAGSPSALGVHPRAQDPADFDAPHAWPNELRDDEQIDPSAIPPDLAPTIDGRTDRVLRTRVQTFGSMVARVEVGTLFGTSTIDLAGRDPRVGRARTGPLAARLGLAASTFVVGVAIALAAYVAHVARHGWFASEGNGAIVLELGIVAAVIAAVAMLGIALGRRGWTLVGTWVPIAAACAPIVAAGVVHALTVPSATHAAQRLARGDERGAALEADAATIYGDRGAAEAVLDGIHMRGVRAATSVAEMSNVVHREWFDEARRAEAQDLLRDALRSDIERAFAAGDLDELRRIGHDVDELVPDARAMLDQHVAALELATCANRSDWACVAAGWGRVRGERQGSCRLESARQWTVSFPARFG